MGMPGLGKNMSSELMSYIYIKKHRERSVLCQENKSEMDIHKHLSDQD
jgi:hypothetical protein